MRLRAGFQIHRQGTFCNKCTQGGRHCNHELDTTGVHSTLCHVGASQNRPHKAGVAVIQKAAQEAGWEALTERVLPELVQVLTDDGWRLRSAVLAEGATPQEIQGLKEREARMDLIAWSPTAPAELLMDFKVRHPCSVKCIRAAAKNDAVAIKAAIKDKERRYGTKVICVPVETFGRQGETVSAIFDAILGQATRPLTARHKRRWQLQLGMTLARCTARPIRESAGSLGTSA